MIAGHFGLAAAVKGRATSTPLWGLMLATQWLDVVFIPTFAAGLEGFEPLPGAAPGAYGGALIHADYTHSLVGALVLSAIFGLFFVRRYGTRSSVVLGAVAFSHWVLDLLFHYADMPIWPGRGAGLRLGLGLWAHPVVAAGIELVLVLVGAWMYGRAALRLAAGDATVRRRARFCSAGVLGGCLAAWGLSLLGL